MKKWSDVRETINIFSAKEKKEMDLLVDLIATLVNRRIDLGLSQRELAQLSGIKQPAIARLEKLEAIPRVDTLIKVLQPLGLSLRLFREKK